MAKCVDKHILALLSQNIDLIPHGLLVQWQYAAFALRRQESDSPRVQKNTQILICVFFNN